MNLSPLPIQKFFDNNGRPLVGGLLFTYEAGTTTKIATYTDAGGTPNTNPVVLDYRGEANVWMDQELTYKFVLAPEGDTDPPTRPIWTVDDISAATTFASLTQQVIGKILFPRTAAEIAAGVTPVNYAWPEGYLLRYGDNANPGTTDMTTAFTNAILANYGRTVWLPGETVLVDDLYPFNASGTTVAGVSKFTSVVKAKASTSAAVFSFASSGSSTSSYGAIRDLCIDLSLAGAGIIGIDLSSCGNCAIDNVFIKGGPNLAGATGIGIKFNAPIAAGAYNNTVTNCAGQFLAKGVVWGEGANKNKVIGSQWIGCTVGLDIDPGGVQPDTPCCIDVRIEAGATGLKEGALQGTYVGLRFENQSVTDVAFNSTSAESSWVGGFTSSTGTPVTGLGSVASIYAMSPDLIGVIWRASSTSRPNTLYGPNVMAPNGDTGTAVNPTSAGSVSLYARGGRIVLDNAQYLLGRTAAGTNVVTLIRANSNNRVELASDGSDIQIGRALIALGGGAAPTLGTIGGSGPATAAQNTWARFFDSGGNAFYVPVWK